MQRLFSVRRSDVGSSYALRGLCSRIAGDMWEAVNVAAGVADYDPQTDSSLNDTFQRADQLMYENKRLRKAVKQNT